MGREVLEIWTTLPSGWLSVTMTDTDAREYGRALRVWLVGLAIGVALAALAGR
jgi:hypothetical protein